MSPEPSLLEPPQSPTASGASTHPLIRSISRIDKYGVFQSWRWPQGALLKSITVIYGANGTGKSTLAALLADAARGDAVDSGLILDLCDQDGTNKRAVGITDRNDSVWHRIHVFDRRYVCENLSFDTDDVSAPHLLTLGKQAVAAVESAARMRQRIEEIQGMYPSLKSKARKARRAHDSLASDAARDIAAQCAAGDPHYDGRRYTARNVRAKLAEDRSRLLSGRSQNLSQDLGTINEHAAEQLARPVLPLVDLAQVEREAADLLARSATSLALDELRDSPQIARWVQEGMALHTDRDRCSFCEGHLTEARREALARHFDQSLLRLQADIQQRVDSLDRTIAEFGALERNLPAATALVASVRERYVEWRSKAVRQADDAKTRLTIIRDALESKLGQPFTTTTLPELPPCVLPDGDELQQLITTHNAVSDNLAEARALAAARIECSRIADIAERIDELQKEEQAATAEIEALETEERDLSNSVAQLSHSDRDPRPLADELTVELERLLGRRELAFTVTGETGRYTIERNGQPATKLSEGERTAISLLYFLASLRQADDGTGDQKKIVVVDDPVSSLDSSVMLGASSHLWLRLYEDESVSQVILLTHSFELLRTWMNLLRDRGSIAELRMQTVATSAGVARKPQLIQWAADGRMRKRLRSEYHYLFWRVASTLADCRANPTSVESKMDAAAVLPNAARKMLEGFLSFKCPGRTGDLEKAVAEQADRVGDAHGHAVVRYLHQQSHFDQVDLQRGLHVDAAIDTLSSVFAFMRAIDQEHVEAMCAALEVDPAII